MALTQDLENPLANAFLILKDFVVPEAQHEETFAIEEFGSSHVVVGRIGMLTTIDFNDEPMGETDEIQDVAAHRLLPSKLEPLQLPASE